MKRIPQEDRVGLSITIIVHLVVIIVLLAWQLGATLSKEQSFVLDFSKLEEIEKLQQELEFQQQINERLNEMLAAEGVGTSPIRAVAVDRSQLKDDRGTDAEKLYEDADRLQKALDQTFAHSDEPVIDVSPAKKKEEKKDDGPAPSYKGPSVVSYTLEGRKMSKMSIPSYRCLGAGQVTVLIVVNNQGKVMDARVDESVSSPDGCLRNFAVRAARLSLFSADPGAPARQSGNIVYEFIAQ